MSRVVAFFERGSSPLTRGKRERRRGSGARSGLIPAHAGKTRRCAWTCHRSWAHPRSRGENVQGRSTALMGVGSSPLTRGKRRPECLRARLDGLIPAHAGKTPRARFPRGQAGAHPRSRGENVVQAWRFHRSLGSSPLTRGKHQSRRECRCRMGLIPAHAGKTTRPSATPSAQRAHPRSRGENRSMSRLAVSRLGSSPLTRGKPRKRGPCERQKGLIPAHAGKTARSSQP